MEYDVWEAQPRRRRNVNKADAAKTRDSRLRTGVKTEDRRLKTIVYSTFEIMEVNSPKSPPKIGAVERTNTRVIARAMKG